MSKKMGHKHRVTPSNWHVYVATPSYDGKPDQDYTLSLAEAAYVAPLFGVKFTASIMGNGAFIDLTRCIQVNKFLREAPECTHLFFVDDDLKFPANAFIGLVRSGLPICAGVYRRRQEPEDYPCRWVEGPDGNFVIEEGWLMCDRVPTGFLCVERRILEEMSKDMIQMNIPDQKDKIPRLFYTHLDEDSHYVGEDYSFCDEYIKKYNKFIPVWPDIDFVHGKTYPGNLAKFLKGKVDEQRQEFNYRGISEAV